MTQLSCCRQCRRTLLHDAFTQQQPASDGEARRRRQKAAATFHLYEGDITGRSPASGDPALIWSCSRLACVDRAVLNTKPHLLATFIAVTFFHFEISTRTNLPRFPFSFRSLSFLAAASLLLSQPLALASITPPTHTPPAPAPPY